MVLFLTIIIRYFSSKSTICCDRAIFNYSIDFVIPEYKVALEIDGRPFHGKDHADKQRKRDEVIIWKLGEDWEIIHIDTDNINANVTKLVPAIKAVLKSRKKTSL